MLTGTAARAGDAHVRVATACLRCLAATLGTCGALLERHLDRLVPPLLVRAADGKEAVRRAAADALAVLPGVYLPLGHLSSFTSVPVDCVQIRP